MMRCIHKAVQMVVIRLEALGGQINPYGRLKHSPLELMHNLTVPE